MLPDDYPALALTDDVGQTAVMAGYRMLTNLQGLRAAAALGVIVFHFGLLPATKLPFAAGAAGVDLFFVLSGFIIAYSSARNADHFLRHRLMRVIPAYWIATFIAALLTLQSLDVAAAADWLVQSLFYLRDPGGRPVLIFVAWTLIYELAFYLIYWLALRLGRRRAPVLSLGMLLALALIPLPGLPGPWPLLIEFAMGIGVYLLTERHGRLRSLRGGAGLLMAGAGVALLPILPLLTGYDPDDYQAIGRVLTWGVPASVIVLGLVVAEHDGLAIRSNAILRLGAASYALYLLHPLVIGQVMQLSPHRPPASWAICAVAVGVTAVLAVAFRQFVEAPLLRWMRALFDDRLPIDQRLR